MDPTVALHLLLFFVFFFVFSCLGSILFFPCLRTIGIVVKHHHPTCIKVQRQQKDNYASKL